MASTPEPPAMTRTSSSDSSTLSNILVRNIGDVLDSASEREPASTPPTSVNDGASLGSGLKPDIDAIDDEEHTLRRPKRARPSVSTYNIAKLSRTYAHANADASGSNRRSVSALTGRTLVAGNEEDVEEDEDASRSLFADKLTKALDVDWELPSDSPPRRSPRKLDRKASVKDRVKKAVSKVTTVLGKRSREVVRAGKRKFGVMEESSPKQRRIQKQLYMGKGGILDEMDLDLDIQVPSPRPTKRQKTTTTAKMEIAVTIKAPATLSKASNGKRRKRWEIQGLYVGQTDEDDMTQESKSKPPEPSPEDQPPQDLPLKKPSFLSLPMFNYLDTSRDFFIPYDVFAAFSKKGGEKPKDWSKINRNRLIGDAKELFMVEKLATSRCVCPNPGPGELACGEDCLNRIMSYDCNKDNCKFGSDGCGNRAFSDLAVRVKKGGAYDIGVEVIKTPECGYGVRSCRTFAPGQIIMEYTGEVISEGECQRRMREEYKDKQCYYLMELERGLVIDGTKGSMARFINHSCAPNCEVRMVKVDGVARMAVFAGDDGITTGDELTYDYNFDNFGTTHQKCFCGSLHCRGFLSKRLNVVELKKMLKEDAEKQRRLAEEALKRTEAEAKKMQIQANRGANWRGWVAVDDPEVKERLRAEKKAKEEAASASDRSRRLAARRQSLPARSTKHTESKRESKRRKTTHATEEVALLGSPSSAPIAEDDLSETVAVTPRAERTVDQVTTTTTITTTHSNFKEEIALTPAENDKSQFPRTVRLVPGPDTVVRIRKLKVRGVRTEEGPPIAAADPDDVLPRSCEENEEPSTNAVPGNLGLARTASKEEEVIRNVGQTLKEGLIAGVAAASQPVAPLKLKQSTLNFAKRV